MATELGSKCCKSSAVCNNYKEGIQGFITEHLGFVANCLICYVKSSVAKLVENGSCNAWIVALTPRATYTEQMYEHMTLGCFGSKSLCQNYSNIIIIPVFMSWCTMTRR